jgi:hypothetical protein
MDLFEDAPVICSYSALDAEDDGILKRQPSWRNGLGLDAPRFASIGVTHTLSAEQIAGLFARYSSEDWGSGECGFASYSLNGETVWLIDDSTRSLEGFPPAMEPGAALGPQTLILSSEY